MKCINKFKNKLVISSVCMLILSGIIPVSALATMPTIDGEFTTFDEWSDGRQFPDVANAGFVYIKDKTIGYPSEYTGLMHDLKVDMTNDVGGGSTDYMAGDFNYFPIYNNECKGTLLWEIYIIANPTAPEYPGKLYKVENGNRIDVTNDPTYKFTAKAGFGTSPNSATSHRMYEFEVSNVIGWLEVKDAIVPFGEVIYYGCVPVGGIPEFPTVALPVISIVGLMLLFQRRKGK